MLLTDLLHGNTHIARDLTHFIINSLQD
ncbi:two-component system connector SafA [Escherichia coli]